MDDEKKGRLKRNGLFILRSLAFLLVFAVLATYTLYVLTPKDDFGAGTMFRFYTQPEDSIDVLALGTSVTYSGINTNVLWANWGIASYNLASAEQSYWNTYYYLKEALKTQKPKLILLDGKACVYENDESPRGRTIVGTYGILSPDNRIGAMKASNSEWFSHVLGFPQIHENWKDITLNDFKVPAWMEGRSEAWKGYVESLKTESHIKPSLVWTNIHKPLQAKQVEYFEKICDLAEEYGIPVLLVAYPNPGYADEHLYYNSLWELADARGIPHINLNDP